MKLSATNVQDSHDKTSVATWSVCYVSSTVKSMVTASINVHLHSTALGRRAKAARCLRSVQDQRTRASGGECLSSHPCWHHPLETRIGGGSGDTICLINSESDLNTSVDTTIERIRDPNNWILGERDIEIQLALKPGSSKCRSDALTNWATGALALEQRIDSIYPFIHRHSSILRLDLS